MEIQDLLRHAAAQGASDLHLKAGNYPMMRVNGALTVAHDGRRLTPADTAALAAALLPAAYQRKFEERQDIDFAYSVPGQGRFRVNVFQQRGSIGLVLRLVQTQIGSFEDLNLPPVLETIAGEERGLVLVTGATTSGKSTTLAALIEHINRHRRCHIITIEDPIEYLHRDRESIINQREVDVDTRSFSHALRSALRQDPDVIMVGEMRDLETTETALMAAETGHLVLSTLHTLDAAETINRTISAFPPDHQRQIRLQLASVLRATVSMRLLARADGCGRVPAVEVMVCTPFVRDCIVDPERTRLIPGAIAGGRHPYGMQTFDQSIFQMLSEGLITYDEAVRHASNVDDFRLKVQGVAAGSETVRGAGDARPQEPPEIVRFGR